MPEELAAQMSVLNNMDMNYKKTMDYISKAASCDLLFFPQLQMSPYFPQVSGLNVTAALNRESDARINGIAYQAKKNNMYISMNVFLEKEGKRYNASLWFDRYAQPASISGLINPLETSKRHEAEYFDPCEEGSRVYRTAYGKAGIVIGTDMHDPANIRRCAGEGASLIIIPAAHTADTLTEMYEWELRTQAYQNSVYIAVCSRCGKEGRMNFNGNSMIIDPDGNIIVRADETEQLITTDIDLKLADQKRNEKNYIRTK